MKSALPVSTDPTGALNPLDKQKVAEFGMYRDRRGRHALCERCVEDPGAVEVNRDAAVHAQAIDLTHMPKRQYAATRRIVRRFHADNSSTESVRSHLRRP